MLQCRMLAKDSEAVQHSNSVGSKLQGDVGSAYTTSLRGGREG